MNDIQLARTLGWLSVGLGTAELLGGRRLGRALGVPRHRALIRGFGLRELAAGAMILAHPDAPAGLWSRVAGDALDLAALGVALIPRRGRPATVAAIAAVAAVTAADIACAQALTARKARAVAVARRTRVQRALA